MARKVGFMASSVMLATLAMASFAPSASAGDFDCNGVLGPQRIESNVVVHDECTLDGTRIQGNVLVKPGALLRVIRGARIDGNLEAKDADVVIVRDSYIQGNVQLERIDLRILIERSVVRGNLELKSNPAEILMGCNYQ